MKIVLLFILFCSLPALSSGPGCQFVANSFYDLAISAEYSPYILGVKDRSTYFANPKGKGLIEIDFKLDPRHPRAKIMGAKENEYMASRLFAILFQNAIEQRSVPPGSWAAENIKLRGQFSTLGVRFELKALDKNGDEFPVTQKTPHFLRENRLLNSLAGFKIRVQMQPIINNNLSPAYNFLRPLLYEINVGLLFEKSAEFDQLTKAFISKHVIRAHEISTQTISTQVKDEVQPVEQIPPAAISPSAPKPDRRYANGFTNIYQENGVMWMGEVKLLSYRMDENGVLYNALDQVVEPKK